MNTSKQDPEKMENSNGSSGPRVQDLRAEILSVIFSFLSAWDVTQCSKVCSLFRRTLFRFPPPCWNTLVADGTKFDSKNFNVDKFLVATDNQRYERVFSIELKSLKRIGKKTFHCIVEKYPSLPRLKLSHMKNVDHLCFTVMEKLPLQELWLSRLTYPNLDSLSSWDNLRVLRINSCLLRQVFVNAISDGLFRKATLEHNRTVLYCPNLETLDISHEVSHQKSKTLERYPTKRYFVESMRTEVAIKYHAETHSPRPKIKTFCASFSDTMKNFPDFCRLIPNVEHLFLHCDTSLTPQVFKHLQHLKTVCCMDPHITFEFVKKNPFKDSDLLTVDNVDCELRKQPVKTIRLLTASDIQNMDAWSFISKHTN